MKTDSTTFDENARSPREELQKKDMLLNKEIVKCKELTKEIERLKTLYEREKFKVEQYNRDMESIVDSRDQQLEKCEQEIFELEETKQKLLATITKIQGELTDERQNSQVLAEQLAICQKQLLDERNRSIPCPVANETALFDAENKVEELKVTVEGMKNDVSRLFNENMEFADRINQLTESLEQSQAEVNSLRSLVDCQRNEMQSAREQILELQVQLHEAHSGNAPTVAPQGNSLFAEVIDGKDKLEKQLVVLHQKNEQLRHQLQRTMKLACENAMNRAATNGKALSGPTLDVFKAVRTELAERLNEKQNLLERLHTVEEQERRHARQWAKEYPTEYKLFQENIHAMNLYAKQRAERRVLQLELREQELLNALSYEKQRGSSVPQLEQRIEQMERTLAYYERNQLSLEGPSENHD